MNSIEKPIFWHHGLFLRPQHFQQNDAFLQSILTPHNLYHTPFFWGCGSMQVLDSSFSRRIIEIEKCEIIFQDGTWLKCPENAMILPRSFEDISFDTKGDTPVTVYVGIKKWDRRNKNVTEMDGAGSFDSVRTRFVCPQEPCEIKDIHEGGEPANIRKMDYILKIFWDNEIDKFSDYLLMPLCRLELDEEKVVISKKFIPPCFTLSASDMLMQMLKSLRENIISRCRVFESYKFSQGFQSSDFDAHFLPHLLVLNSLNRSLPILNHMIDLANFHPQKVYAALKQMVGDLSTFTDRINALGQTKDGLNLLPDYDHENLYHCFNEAHLLISELLRGISIGGESIIHMMREGNYFTAQIAADEFRDPYMYFFVVKTKKESDQIVNDMHNIVKIGPKKNMENMISRALPGLPVRHRLVPPPGMPKRSDSYFFRIDTKHYLWEEIQRACDICLFWNNAPDDAAIELVISQL
jgi:type VI secretion system protein ImpJ